MNNKIERKSRAIFTICCRNYIAFAATLMNSIREHNPNCDRYIILCEDSAKLPTGIQVDASVVSAVDLKIANFRKMAFGYDLIELNTCIKPSAIKYLLSKGYDEVMYLDPDIEVFDELIPLWPSAHNSCTVLTPHITSRYPDRCRPSETDVLANGLYNLGFLSVADTSESLAFLDWWEQKCQTIGFDDKSGNLFVDQKFCDMVPILFKGVYISGHLGANIAYWNLHERIVTQKDGRFLINGKWVLLFYHYSGIGINCKTSISKHTDRFTLENRPDLNQLFGEYREKVIKNGYLITKDLEYSFGFTNEGRPILKIERLLFLANHKSEKILNPFDRKRYDNQREWYLRDPSKLSNLSMSPASYNNQQYRILLDLSNCILKCICWLITTPRYIQLCSRLEKAFRLRTHVNLLSRNYSNPSPVELSLGPSVSEKSPLPNCRISTGPIT